MPKPLERTKSWPESEDRRGRRQSVRQTLALVHELPAAVDAAHPIWPAIDVRQRHARRDLEPILEDRWQREGRIPVDRGFVFLSEHPQLLPCRIGIRKRHQLDWIVVELIANRDVLA